MTIAYFILQVMKLFTLCTVFSLLVIVITDPAGFSNAYIIVPVNMQLMKLQNSSMVAT